MKHISIHLFFGVVCLPLLAVVLSLSGCGASSSTETGETSQCGESQPCPLGQYCEDASGECVSIDECASRGGVSSENGTCQSCGDGIVNGDEACDDGDPTARCNADCTLSTCGDGKVNAAANEQCDQGSSNGTLGNCCTLSCERVIDCNAFAPVIITQPESRTVLLGATTRLSVVATSAAPLMYQWYHDGQAISGAVAGQYEIAAVRASDAGTYSVVITNNAGNVTSTPVTLSVHELPAFSSQPDDRKVTDGDTVSFTIEVTGTPTPVIAWEQSVDGGASWLVIGGASGTTYEQTATAADNGLRFRASVSNYLGTVTSRVVNLTVTKASVANFHASPSRIGVGDGTWLSWQNVGSSSSSIDNGVGDVSGKAFVWVTPSASTTYTLTSLNALGVPTTVQTHVVVVSSSGAGKWVDTSALQKPRNDPTVTLLSDGRVLLVGGGSVVVETYDPTTDTWSKAADLPTIRYAHTATLLADGRVLVAGGKGTASSYLATASLYDPATDTWNDAGTMSTTRAVHTATLLADGRVLVAGGMPSNYSYIASAELYDPATNSWMPTGSLAGKRRLHTATPLSDGRVLVIGGDYGSNGGFYAAWQIETYDPATGVWTTAKSSGSRQLHTATLLPSGKVLVTGGYSDGYLATAAVYDPVADSWVSAPNMSTKRAYHTATLLADGKVLVAGGYYYYYDNSGDTEVYVSAVDVYDPATNTWTAAAPLPISRRFHAATLLDDGRVLVAGGEGGSDDEGYAVTHRVGTVYDPL